MHDVYEDCDEHIRMKIEEMLSDGVCIYFNIRYEALDDEGEHWLVEQGFDVRDIGFVPEDNDSENTTGWRHFPIGWQGKVRQVQIMSQNI